MSVPLFNAERSPRLLHADETIVSTRRSCFTELIQQLFPRDLDAQCRPTLFTSPHPGAGVSFICSSVATELAGPSSRVLLADAQTLMWLARRSGSHPEKSCERVDLSRLWILGPKQISNATPETHNGVSTVTPVLGALREAFTHIVIDAPALSCSNDAIALAASVHGIVLVAQAGGATVQDVVSARRKFVSLGGKVHGIVYNARPLNLVEGSRP